MSLILKTASNLLRNEFNVLKAEYSSSAEEISDLLEDAEFEGIYSDDVLIKAQQTLVAPKDRLIAELCWLPELSRQQREKALQVIKESDTSQVPQQIDHFPDLAKANILAYCASEMEGAKAIILSLCNCWDDLDLDALTNFINDNRKLAGFPKVSLAQVEDVVSNICLKQAITAAASIWRSGVPGFLMNSIVEKELSRKPESTFLKNLVREYDKNSEKDLAEIAQKISDAAEKAKSAGDDLGFHIQDIDGYLFQWDEINQPVQLYDQSRGHEEARSKALYQELRALSVELANEHNRFEASLQLSEALLRTFPELESAAEILRGDVTDLEDLVEQEKNNRILQPLFEACDAAKDAPLTPLKATLRAEGFSERSEGVIGEIAGSLQRSCTKLDDTRVAYMIVRNLCLYWNNEKEDPEAAFLLIDGLITYAGNALESEMSERLSEDRATLHTNWKMGELESNRGNKTAILRTLDDLLIYAKPSEKYEFEKLRNDIKKQSTKKYIKWSIYAVIGLFILLSIIDSESKKRTSETKYTPSNSSSQQSVSVSSESMPPVGTGLSLTESQVRYCIFQDKRLDFMRNMLSDNAEISHFNRLVGDWNARCSNYRYLPAIMSKIQDEVAGRSHDLQLDAQRILGK